MTLRFGFAGTGFMAERTAQTLAQVPDAALVAVSSGSLTRAQTFAARHGGLVAVEGVAALAALDQVDAVYVCGRSSSHAEDSITALKAGKPVLCEKPFALSSEEGARVRAAAHASGALFMENLWTHALPAWQALKKAVASGAIGTPSVLQASFGYPASAQAMPRLYGMPDGGVIFDRMVYPLSHALSLLGPVESLDARITRNSDGIDVRVDAVLHHKAGGVSHIGSALDLACSNILHVAGTHGSAQLGPPFLGGEALTINCFNPDAKPSLDQGLKARLKTMPIVRKLFAMRPTAQFISYGGDAYSPQIGFFVAAVAGKISRDELDAHQALSDDCLHHLAAMQALKGTPLP